MKSSRIVITTLGSLGDLYPSLAIGRELVARGHSVVMAVSDDHRESVANAGLEFAPVRPHFMMRVDTEPEMMARLMNPATGVRMLLGELVMPAVRDSYADLTAASMGCDTIISHSLTPAAPMVAQKMGVRWGSVVLAPLSFFSAHEHNRFNPVWLANAIAKLRPALRAHVLQVLSLGLRPMGGPVQALRRELNLAPAKYPVFDGQTSPYLTLATFSKALAQPQPDWPNNTVQTGYCFYEGTGKTLSPEVEEFLQPHFPPPIVFTLGSSCVWAAKDFFQIAARTALSVNRRALLLVGNDARNRANLPTHPDILTCAYAPHSLVFPRSSAIVHQGGVGTTGQALRSGRPSVIMPYAFDQLDNAMRCVERHCAVTLDKSKLADAPLAGALSKVLTNPDLIEGAKRAATVLATENGVATACDAIEERLLEK